MSTMNAREERTTRNIREQAAEWLLILEDGRAEDRGALAEWLTKSPLHIEAFLRASAMDTLLSRVDPQRAIEVNRNASAAEVTDIAPEPQVHRDSVYRRPRFLARHAAAAVVLIMLGALIWWHGGIASWTRSQHFSTAIGEQRVLELPDGSVLHLNTRSEAKVQFDAHERRVQLLSGEALFWVQRDPARPFRVHSGAAIIEAVGTRFNVHRRNDEALVSVLEGVVKVTKEAEPATADSQHPVRLVAGEQIRIGADGSASAKTPADLTRVSAWRQRRLIFRDEPLSAIAAEFNRYNSTPKIRIEGVAAGERRYAAVFDADDPESLLTILAKDPALDVQQREDELVIRPRGPGPE